MNLLILVGDPMHNVIDRFHGTRIAREVGLFTLIMSEERQMRNNWFRYIPCIQIKWVYCVVYNRLMLISRLSE